MKASTLSISLVVLGSCLACSAPDESGSRGTDNGTAAASGSVGTPIGGSPGATGGSGGSGIIIGPGGGQGGGSLDCGRKNFMVEPKPAHVLLVLDRSASMKEDVEGNNDAPLPDQKWTLVVPALKEVITQTNGAVNWGLKVFPEGNGNECVTGSVTANIDVPVAPMNATAVNTRIDMTLAEGNGTPTGDAITAAVPHIQSITDPGPKYLLLATDGEPSCAGTNEGQEAARPYAVTAVRNAATAGFHTFVVGVATTSDNARQALNDMADAGLEPNPQATNPLADRFYLANTRDQLVEALRVITGEVISCVFPLGETPPVIDNIGVRVGTDLAPRDETGQNGWNYTDSTHMTVEVYGEWCERVRNASARSVEIIFACRGEIIR